MNKGEMNMNEAMKDLGGIECSERVQDKHEGIYDAIQNIDSVAERLQDIIARMTEAPSADTGDAKCAGSISFVDLMDKGESMIRSRVNGAHGLLNEIERIVFGGE
jgi:hypothetical protein